MGDKRGRTRPRRASRMTETKSRKRRGRRALTLKIEGPGIRPGRVPLPELVEICKHIQAAVMKQADVIQGHRSTRPGRKTAKVLDHCTLELSALGTGSARLSFDAYRPPEQPAFIPQLGENAIAGVAIAIEALERGEPHEIDRGVLESLDGLGETLNGRIRSVKCTVPFERGRRKLITATIDKRVAARIKAQLARPTAKPKPIEIDGILEMADFKEDEHKCRVRPAVGASVNCWFEEDISSKIQQQLRKPTRVVGVARRHPVTGRPEEVQIVDVSPAGSELDVSREFFANRSIGELAALQGISPITDIKTLAGGIPDDFDIDAELAETYRRRH
jgi:hypothetical protein